LSSELQLIHSKILECTKCELHKSRTKAVPGEGPRDARIMFVGEGPGQNEDEQGRPFVGAAGKFLTELLESIGLKRSDVFITNIVKCRPPNNRAPRKSEIEACNNRLRVRDPGHHYADGRGILSKQAPRKILDKGRSYNHTHVPSGSSPLRRQPQRNNLPRLSASQANVGEHGDPQP